MGDNFDLTRFYTLEKAFVDASSLIYMQKAGFLRQLREHLILYTVPEILNEVGMSKEGFRLVSCHDESLSNDRKLLHCADKHRISLISEDRKLLLQAEKAGLAYYNSLMMLNFLLCTEAIDSKDYEFHCRRLQSYARYSNAVRQYGERVHQRIKAILSE